mgnify:CR=1 FL=1
MNQREELLNGFISIRVDRDERSSGGLSSIRRFLQAREAFLRTN